MSATHTPRKMDSASRHLIDEINQRQDEVLGQLDELNNQIESLIDLCVATAKEESGISDDEPEQQESQQPVLKIPEDEVVENRAA